MCVRILLWDDATSIDSSVLNAVLKKTKTGLMNTFDEQTMRFFRNSGPPPPPVPGLPGIPNGG